MLKSYTSDLTKRLDDPEYAKKYGAELAKLDYALTLMRVRTGSGLTQQQLSERLGISQPYIAKLESGEANPTLASIGKMLAVLGFRLVTGTESLKPETNPFDVRPIQIHSGSILTSNIFSSHLWSYGTWLPNSVSAPAAGLMGTLVSSFQIEPSKECVPVGGQA